MGLQIDAIGGLIRLACAPYDKTVVDSIKALPERRYRRDSQDWSVPARREYLRSICGVIAELEERGIDVDLTEHAAARLSRLDVGRGVLRDNAIEIAGPYSERRLPALRALPERRFDAERKIWMIPLTRAGALAILALADGDDELVITQRARRASERSAAATPPPQGGARHADEAHGPTRRSPIAHWRHYTAGPVFDNPAHDRIDVPGIGWCVRIRVNPRNGRAHSRRAEP